MTTKKTTKTRAAKRTETSERHEAGQAAYEAHTIAQLVYRHLFATGRLSAWSHAGGPVDPRFGLDPSRPPVEHEPWGSVHPMTPPHLTGHWPV